jgi:PAS domain S-box-containing protein
MTTIETGYIMTDTHIPEAIGHLLFRRASDLAFNAITVTRATGENSGSEIIYVNDAFTDMTGYESEEVIGKTPGMLQGPKTEQKVLDRLEREIEAGETFHGQTVNYRKDGSEFMIEWKVAPVEQNGETTHYIAVQRDVTDRS